MIDLATADMAERLWVHLGLALVAATVLQLGLWTIQQRSRNAGIVDVGWAASFSVFIAVWGALTPTPFHQWWPIATAVLLWSLRLTWYLVWRGAATGPEDGRYRTLRERWQPHASRAFLVFFLAQALLAAVLSIAHVFPFASTLLRPTLQWVGLALVVVGVIGEALADYQLARFKRTVSDSTLVCDVGLWSVSRHPNYFFETVVWCGFATIASAYGWGALAWGATALIVASIFRVTGIPATEAQALARRGHAYRAYQARVSVFVPWFPKKGQAQESSP